LLLVRDPGSNIIYHSLTGDISQNKKRLLIQAFLSGEGGIRTRGGGLSPRTHLAGEPNQPLWHLPIYNCPDDTQRREWDSNPRWLAPRRFSRPLPSAARSSLRAEGFYHKFKKSPLIIDSIKKLDKNGFLLKITNNI
jgi:hypothetical protein